MIVPDELSQFKEEEIILFPFFYFSCENVENFTSGARYECKQQTPTDEWFLIKLYCSILCSDSSMWFNSNILNKEYSF